MVGLLTPSGIASDKTAAPFFKGVATGGRLKALCDFENRRTRFEQQPFFPNVDSRRTWRIRTPASSRRIRRRRRKLFLMGHISAFAFFGGVPLSILYDNLKIAVAHILGDGKRQRTRAFTELVSHYLFQERFGSPGKGNDKGKVEAGTAGLHINSQKSAAATIQFGRAPLCMCLPVGCPRASRP
jgi:hypothetical protein